LTVARLSEVNRDDAERRLELFEEFWKEFSSCMRKHASVVDSLDFRVKTKLRYYGKIDFLQGMVARTRDIIDGERFVEASHYVLSSFYSMVENYISFISVVKENRFSRATLLSVLRGLEESAQLCESVVEAFGLSDVDREEARDLLRLARELVLGVRGRRRALIDWFVG